MENTKIDKILSDLQEVHPYKIMGNPDTYSDYNQGWANALECAKSEISEALKEYQPRPISELDTEYRGRVILYNQKDCIHIYHITNSTPIEEFKQSYTHYFIPPTLKTK